MATWTDPQTWTAAVVSVADMNTHIRDNETFLYGPPRVQVKRTGDQTINNNLLTEIAWQAEDWDIDDNGEMWTSSPGAHLIVRTAGIYLIYWRLEFDADATGIRLMQVSLNDVAVTGQGPTSGASALATRFAGSFVSELSATNFATFDVYQSSGGDLNLDFNRSHAGLHWLSGPS